MTRFLDFSVQEISKMGKHGQNGLRANTTKSLIINIFQKLQTK